MPGRERHPRAASPTRAPLPALKLVRGRQVLVDVLPPPDVQKAGPMINEGVLQ
ncbi:MAG: hypothetical protein WAK17_09555 [Candidatus Nitrosopolaris sp.]